MNLSECRNLYFCGVFPVQRLPVRRPFRFLPVSSFIRVTSAPPRKTPPTSAPDVNPPDLNGKSDRLSSVSIAMSVEWLESSKRKPTLVHDMLEYKRKKNEGPSIIGTGTTLV